MKTIVYNNPKPWFTPLEGENLLESIQTVAALPLAYHISYSLADFRKKDLSVSIQNNTLRVEAKTTKQSLWNKNRNAVIEKYVFEDRSLIDDMEIKHIKARFRHGTLSKEILKKEEGVNYREIPISGTSTPIYCNSSFKFSIRNIVSWIKHRFRQPS